MKPSPRESAFEDLAEDYDRLLDDPLRKTFAGDSAFFIEQKCRALLRRLDEGLPSSVPPRVLDVGCGQGTALAFLRERCLVFGSDVSLPMLLPAVKKGPVVVQEPFDLPFETGVFDAAFSFCVYHHIASVDHVTHLRELSRVVRPGGLVLIFEHNPLNPVTRRVFRRSPIDRNCDLIGARRLCCVFADAGLRQIRRGYVVFVPQALNRALGWLEPHLEWLPFGGQYYVVGVRP